MNAAAKEIKTLEKAGMPTTPSEVAQALRSAAASGGYIAERLEDF